MQSAYLLKDDNDESIYPTQCFKLFNSENGKKEIDLNSNLNFKNDIYIKLFNVWHLNISNKIQIWKPQKDFLSLTELKNVINKDDLIKVNDQFEKKDGDYRKMLIYMSNKKILTEYKAN